MTNYGTPAAGSTQTITLPAGGTITVAYDGSARVTSYSNGVGTWSYSYSTSGSSQTTTVTDPNSNKKTYVSNPSQDTLTSYTDALNRTTSYGYDGYGRLTSVTHPHGDVVSYTYDQGLSSPRGDVTTTTWTPAGGGTAIVTHASYDASCSYPAKCNKPNSTTDGRGNVTTYTYDNGTGVPLTVTRPANNAGVQPQTRYSYTALTASGQNQPILMLTGISTCNSKSASSCVGTSDETRTTISYDAGHNLAPSAVTVAAGDGSISSTQSFSYDGLVNLSTSTNPLSAQTTYVYDADREPTGVIGPDPDGSGPLIPTAVQMGYTPDGKINLLQTGTVNSSSDTAFSSFTLVARESLSYDSEDRLSSVSDNPVSNGSYGSAYAMRQYQYDKANRLQCSTVRMNASALGSEPAACSLGPTGTDGPDRITQLSYDAADEMQQVLEGVNTTWQRRSIYKGYNSDGTISVVFDGNNNGSCYGYDGFGRTAVTYYELASRNSDCNGADYQSYAYDANGNLTSKRRRSGTTINYSYDALNTMLNDGTSTYAYDLQGRITDPINPTWATHINYDALGRKASEYNSFGGNSLSAYDANGDRTSLTWQDGHYVTYTYDPLGRVTVIKTDAGTVLAIYAYDSLGRMTQVSLGAPNVAQTYAYGLDSRLFLTSTTFNGSSLNLQSYLAFNAAGQIKVRSLTNGNYDWSGSAQVQQGYGINGLNQVTSAGATGFSYSANGELASDGTHAYGYDPTYGMLTSLQGGGSSVALSYDALQRLVQTQAASTTRFTYDGLTLIEEQDGSGNMERRYVPGADGTPLVWFEGTDFSTPYYLMKDQQGSVIAIANSAGNVSTLNTYDAYGQAGANNSGRFQYAGVPYIPEAGLYNMGLRSYSTSLGRFLQTDPVGYADGMNWYAYTHNDPVNGTDPSGLGCYACFAQVTVLPDGGYYYHADGGTYYFSSGGNAADPNMSGVDNDQNDGTYIPDDFGFTFTGTGGPTDGERQAVFANIARNMNKPQSGKGGGTPANPGPDRTNHCSAVVAAKDGAGAALDAASLIPGGGDAADVARFGAVGASLTISVVQGNNTGIGLGAAGFLASSTASASQGNYATGLTKNILEAVPVVGSFVGALALGADAVAAAQDFQNCMAGH